METDTKLLLQQKYVALGIEKDIQEETRKLTGLHMN
jgi:hypothetical protein